MKTISMRVDDGIYTMIKQAADGVCRTTSESFVSDNEMDEITQDKELLKNFKRGAKDIKEEKYVIVR